LNLSTHKKSEVELRVAQELKNNKDFIYQTNQAIQRINDNLVALSLAIERVRTETESRVKSLSIYTENFREILEEKIDLFDQRIGSVEATALACKLYVGKLEEQIKHECHKKAEFEEEKDKLDEHVKQLYSLVNLQRESLSHQQENLRGHVRNCIQEVRKEIPVMPDLQPLVKKIDEMLTCFKIDFEGVARELMMVKKNVAYGEKKFENIYTLIERLKGEK